ncbi:MAG: ABC transporter substrate-binding protein [Candidatus Thioglobus sp.]|nr:MAG: ABC transporter substrate-binding protein [Candidatus Thioglobus sp.]
MLKRLVIILTIVYMNLAFAERPNENTPHSVAVNVMEGALLSLKTLQEQNENSLINIESLVLNKLMPNVDIDFATKIMLRDRWNDLSPKQQTMFIDYITRSIVQDYVGLLNSYENLDDLNIQIEDGSTINGNKASVKLHIAINKNNYQSFITLKMVKLDRWYIYDAVFPGISILMHYQKSFDSIIKRKGMDGLIAIVNNN